MGRSNNVNRPYVRKSRNGGASQTRTGVESGAGEAKELLSRAGQAERPSIEQLERRHMLFSLTVSADTVDPNSGLGTARAFFHYYIPYLATSETFTDQPPESVAESFDQAAYGAIGSGFVFDQSALQFFHNINPASDISVTAVPQTQDNNNRFVRANLNDTGEFYALRFFDTQDPNTRQRIAVRSLSMFVGADPTAIGGDNSGFLTNDMQIELFLNDTVTATFTGQQIVNLFDANNIPPGTNPANGTGNFSVTAPNNVPAFDEIRFTMLRRPTLGVTPSFILDDISYTKTNNKYAQLMTTRAFGAAVALSGPVGASVTFKDLYGRDMLNSLAGIPGQGSELNPGDLDDNG
ncbi:MAG: hypothetical protein NTV94_11885, partial [Planctomycetota bacterium]|nr:hypothetical protein [Planctomycetota bacterium]